MAGDRGGAAAAGGLSGACLPHPPRRCLRTGADQGSLRVPPAAPAAVPQNRGGSGLALGASRARPPRCLRTGADQGSLPVPPGRARGGASEQGRIGACSECLPHAPALVPQNRHGSGLALGTSRPRPQRCLRTGTDRGLLRVPAPRACAGASEQVQIMVRFGCPVHARAGASEQAWIRDRFGCLSHAPHAGASEQVQIRVRFGCPVRARAGASEQGRIRACSECHRPPPRRCLRTGADQGSRRGVSPRAPVPAPQNRRGSGLASGACHTARAGDNQPLDLPHRGAGSGAPR